MLEITINLMNVNKSDINKQKLPSIPYQILMINRKILNIDTQKQQKFMLNDQKETQFDTFIQ